MAEDLVKICHYITSEKITERKKALDRLKLLLNNNNVIAFINSRSQGKSGVTWNKLFESSVIFFDKEVSKLEKDERSKENPSAATRTNRQNAKRMAIYLPKFILKHSCQGTPFISATLVCDFVLKILKRENPYRLENYATDSVHIIQKYIFQHPEYYMSLVQQNWKDLLHICIFVYENVKNIDRISVLNVVEAIVTKFDESRITSAVLSSPSVTLKRIKPFLKEIAKESASKKNYGMQSAIISLFYSICSQYGSQWRCLLCQIGEETFENLLSILEKKTDDKKITLLKYLDFQLILHTDNPGKICQDLNNRSLNSQCWQKNKKQLYLVIYEYILEVCSYCRISKNVNMKEFMPDEFEILAARLCSQLFNDYEEVTTLEVTQIGATQTQASTSKLGSKRRKIEIGFSSISEKLQDHGSQNESIPCVLLYILLATVLHECESIEDGSSYIDLKPPYILHQNLGHDDSKEDFNNNKNFELSERLDLRNPSMPFYLFKEENGELLDLLSPPINNLLKSNQYLKNQLIMNLIGLKPKNENHKLQNFPTSNLANKRTLNTSKDRKEYLYHELHPTKNNKSNFQISTSKNQQVSLPLKRGTCCSIGVGSKGKCFPCERAHTDVMYEVLREYASLPLTIVNLTNSLNKGEEICSNIDSKLFESDLKKFPRIKPNWLKKVHTLGACPFSLKKRYLSSNSLPSVIVELQCHCKGSVCSKYGGDFRCTAVQYPIQTLVKNDQSENFRYDIEFVTAACVCAQIPSANAIDGNEYFIADSEYSKK